MSLSPEDKIIVWIISLGIAIGLFLYIGGNVSGAIKPSPVLVSVFIAIGFSAAIYRFLGGLSESGMRIGPAKLAGTAAAFLAITWFLNQSLEKQWISTPVSVHAARLSIIPNEWFAMDKNSGEPVKVDFVLNDSVVSSIPAGMPDFGNRQLILERAENTGSAFAFSIKTHNGQDSLLLGGISQGELSKNKLFSSFSDNSSILFTSDLVKPVQEVDIAPELPFVIRTGEYTQNLTRFGLIGRKDRKVLTASSIYLRGGKIFEVADRLFLIMITQVDHTRAEELGGPYAKFGIIELNPK
ncbi:hypothetical protein [Flavilitoribacter nigricans]|uniref:Uncharacterized protein n=1 Tax=Flavilitoribacter nigricans (strain ATCC 23147 / DSM 23189 / NBRC 102662 / NCIMB 1420 / SS-2) TaxID=1122177 RepID=A0A2D0NDR5_FLAN2|nr:hypothetical protein [Flavilitoribacter nigricans]PHN06548.1 hypothetical protein CRP01_09595 [Flavilitoribacter nigricans DSM 23189 = NBRC 102662]